MDKVLKIGIIGCGAIGKDHCRRIIETVGRTVVAVSDYVAAAARPRLPPSTASSPMATTATA